MQQELSLRQAERGEIPWLLNAPALKAPSRVFHWLNGAGSQLIGEPRTHGLCGRGPVS